MEGFHTDKGIEMIDSTAKRILVWEEYHPAQKKSDFFILRLYNNGDYERYANVLLKVDENSNPVYEKVAYQWRREIKVSEKGMTIINQSIKDKIQSFSPTVQVDVPTERNNSVIKAYVDGKEYILELPNQIYDPERYAFVQHINELIITHGSPAQ